MRIETAAPDDAPVVVALIAAALADSRVAAPLIALAGSSARRPGDECRCLLARDQSRVSATVLYGMIAGADGGARVHALAGEPVAADRLVQELKQRLHASGVRIAVAEWPDLPSLAWQIGVLQRHGFEECGRVHDYHDEGIDLLLLRMSIA